MVSTLRPVESQSYSVMVAPEFLVLLVKVRILVGLPLSTF